MCGGDQGPVVGRQPKVARRSWNGIPLEVYYLAEHPWNVPKMLDAMQGSLSYYSANFSPYTQREARIIKFPRVASFAQAFPGTMPYSESIGFIANLSHPDDIDKVYFVVGHEMGHQWWAYQVLGANMEGATSLSETLAQYPTMMVMEHRYGADQMRKFLSYNMDGYLRARGRELLKEKPLAELEASQGYIHYDKGAVVMYSLRNMIGEDAVKSCAAPGDRRVRVQGAALPDFACADGCSARADPSRISVSAA